MSKKNDYDDYEGTNFFLCFHDTCLSVGSKKVDFYMGKYVVW